jgi:hypothetical protein
VRRTTLWTIAVVSMLGLAVLAATPPENLPQALEAQRRLVADHPGDAAAQNDLGNLLLLAGDRKGAEAAYRQAVELAPDRASYHYNFALLLQQIDRPGQAQRHYRRVVELEPTNAWATYQVGALLEREGRRRAAIDWYARAFRLDPDLAFPDVNPHLIESELTAEAMLRGYRSAPLASSVPRIYEEPGRISALLVPPDVATPTAVATTPEASVPGGGQAQRAGGVGQATPSAGGAEPSAGGEGRVLTGDDLLFGPINQAAPPGGAAPPSATRPGRPNRGGTTVVVPGTVGQPDAGRNAPRRPGAQPNDRVIAPREGAPFRPGLPSTGRLDTLLVEETERLG